MVKGSDKWYILQRSRSVLLKWEHLVSVYAGSCANYQAVCEEIYQQLPMTKAAALELRQRLLTAPL